jgi:hypothetical protein
MKGETGRPVRRASAGDAPRGPFLVFSLPRSRSAWLSVFLAGEGAAVGHDIGIGCATPEDFTSRLASLAGTCETGAAFAWPLIRQMIPDARCAVVWRDPMEVAASLARLGFPGQESEMVQRAEQLADLTRGPGVRSFAWTDLGREDTARTLYRHCRRAEAPADLWRRLDPLNIQVDMRRRVAALTASRQQTAMLKAEVARRLARPGLAIGAEPWSEGLWAEARALAEAHFEEVDGGVEPRRPFALDETIMARLQAAGALRIVTARMDGRLVGYFTWNITLDPESRGLLIGQQGAWYVAPGHPRAAVMMFDASVELLKRCGVKCVFPHHRAQGRGAGLGKFFRRRGATKIQDTYSLWIGD